MKFLVIILMLYVPYCNYGQNEINQLDSIGRKDGLWVYVPDSVDMIWPFKNIVKNNSDDLKSTLFLHESIKDSCITVKAIFDHGLLNGPVYYYISDSILVMQGIYEDGKKNGVFYFYKGHKYLINFILST